MRATIESGGMQPATVRDDDSWMVEAGFRVVKESLSGSRSRKLSPQTLVEHVVPCAELFVRLISDDRGLPGVLRAEFSERNGIRVWCRKQDVSGVVDRIEAVGGFRDIETMGWGVELTAKGIVYLPAAPDGFWEGAGERMRLNKVVFRAEQTRAHLQAIMALQVG